MNQTILHLVALNDTFLDKDNFDQSTVVDYEAYKRNSEQLEEELDFLNYKGLLYQEKGRQMILSDFLEYVFLGRIYYGMTDQLENRNHFFKSILLFVNLLMYYEDLTCSDRLREAFTNNLQKNIPEITGEEKFSELKNHSGYVGISEKKDAGKDLDDYFDTLLPKTAGGLWHELLAYVFVLRSDIGYIIPLLLTQKFIGFTDHLSPPDFLVIESKHKRMIGIEIGSFKERQSNTFMIKTGIPTISLDTRNSRTDRCPICHRWIGFCPFVINNYSNLDDKIENYEIKCLIDCDLYKREEIARGCCPLTKYRRNRIGAEHSHHPYANNYHYHYQCVLNNLNEYQKDLVINAEDETALKAHFPFYSGLEGIN